MADNRREQLALMQEKMRKLKYLKVDIEIEDKLSERHQNQIIQSTRELQIVGEIEFQLNNGRRLQEEVDAHAKNVNKRVNKLYETMHHNDFKGQTEFYVSIVVDKIKEETNEVLAYHAEIMERIKLDHENTPQAQAQKALQEEIRDLEERLDKNKVDIQKNKDAMNGFEEKTTEFFKTIEDECAEMEAQIRAIDQTEQNVHEMVAEAEGLAKTSPVCHANEQGVQRMDTDDTDDELTLIPIPASHLFEHLPFALKREGHSDSDSSDDSQCNEPSTSGKVAVRNDQPVQALNQDVRSASSTPPSVRDENRPKNDRMPRPNTSEREIRRNSDGIFDENRRAVRSQETKVRHSSVTSVQDSNKHGVPLKSNNASASRQNRQTPERYFNRDHSNDRSAQTSLAGANKSSARFVEPSATAPHATKRKDASFDHATLAKKSHYDSQHDKRDVSVEKSRRDMRDIQKAQGNIAARRVTYVISPMSTQHRSAESSPENAGVSTQPRDSERYVRGEPKSAGTLESKKDEFKRTDIYTPQFSSKTSSSDGGSVSSKSSGRSDSKPTATRDTEQFQMKAPPNRSAKQATRGDSGSTHHQNDERQGYHAEPKPNVQQGAKGERQIEKRQMKMENDFHDDFSYFSDGNGGLDGFDSFDDFDNASRRSPSIESFVSKSPNVKKTSNPARDGENANRNGNNGRASDEEGSFNDFDFENNSFVLDDDFNSTTDQNRDEQDMDFGANGEADPEPSFTEE